jgi:hypothetical protein
MVDLLWILAAVSLVFSLGFLVGIRFTQSAYNELIAELTDAIENRR